MSPSQSPTSGTLDQLLLTLSVNVDAIAICEVDKNWRLSINPMSNPVVHYILDGNGILTAGGKEIVLSKDCFVIVPEGMAHHLQTTASPRRQKRALEDCTAIGDGILRMKAGSACELVSTCGAVSAKYGQELGFFDHLKRPVVVQSQYSMAVRNAFDRMLEEISEPSIGTRAITSALMKQCIVLMVRSELNRTTDSYGWLWSLRDDRLGSVILAMLDRPAEDHSVEGLAKIAAMSRSAFSKRFSESFGVSPIEFLTLIRLSQAAHLLAHTKLPVKVVASSVGYTSRSYFSRTFRAHYEMDPTGFREKYGSSANEPSWQPLKALQSLFKDVD